MVFGMASGIFRLPFYTYGVLARETYGFWHGLRDSWYGLQENLLSQREIGYKVKEI